MAGTLNKWQGIGNLGKDPDCHFTESGAQCTKFSIAVDQGYGQRKKTLWMPVVTWQKLAEICNNYLKAGTKVYVSGELELYSYKGADGIERHGVQVTATEMLICSSKNTVAPASQNLSPSEVPQVELEETLF